MHATLSPAASGSSTTQRKPRLLRFSVTVDSTRASRWPFRMERCQRSRDNAPVSTLSRFTQSELLSQSANHFETWLALRAAGCAVGQALPLVSVDEVTGCAARASGLQ